MRSVRQLHRAVSDDIGDLRTRRPLPNPRLPQIDPFLFLNHHGPQVYPPDNHGLPFGPHPHRGFETVTFIIEGSLAHRDSGGHESVIHAGGVQWMTAGRGLEHSELSPEEFMKRGGALEILQLWVNLPSRLKMVQPRYIGLQKNDIPTVVADDGRVLMQLVSGEWHDRKGAVESFIGMQLMSLELAHDGRVTLPAPRDHNVFLYVVRGEARVADTHIPDFHLAQMNDDGDEIILHAIKPSIVLFGHAAPIGEPVVAHGPFVMNTAEEIVQAVRDYHAGLFG